ncbi:hypothetical protein N7471_008389 [Penicillium samsonianum]|uniref:uncharacterized protein n=1 Tax=Penicillium samsonianum TaxID=1882272 RepID=UPI00254926F3|nr:uncharacterized protein N7471_008389 [Penicillium samsonianum]KAJ6133174.1 hypothetical protein N7471_008389 [Penicillium samsonianum]
MRVIPSNLTHITSVKPQVQKRRFIVIFVLAFEVKVPASKCKTGLVLELHLHFFTTERITGTRSNPTSVSNTTRAAVMINMKASLFISNTGLDLPNRVKTKSATTTLAIIILKESTPMRDSIIHPQSSTSTQKSQMTRLTASTVTLRHQHEVLVLVRLSVSHMRTGAVAT